jgi:hypothetical protein
MGGHRLWRAPEVPAVTYQPDDEGATVLPTGNGVVLTGAPDRDGIVKQITVTQRGDATVVDHELHNGGAVPVETAPWSITQFATGGTAILPQETRPVDPDGVLPNRHLVLWPYTDLASPEVSFATDTIRIEASTSPAKLKLGWANRRGWLAYALGDRLFVKWASLHDDGAVYTDHGASAQCYRDEFRGGVDRVLLVLNPRGEMNAFDRLIQMILQSAADRLERGRRGVQAEVHAVREMGIEPHGVYQDKE